jgi:membrane protease subunit HflC
MNKIVLAVIGIVVVVLGIVGSASLFTVHQTQQALVLQFGNPVRVESEPGLKFKLPFVQDVTFYDRRILDLDPPAQEIILNDQKRINVDSFVRYKIINPLEFLKTAQTDANFRQIFGGRLNAAVRSEVGKVLLQDMLSNKRDDVMALITKQLMKQASQFGIEVIDVRIGRTDLPDTTSQSVYNRMRSQRIAEAAKLRSQGAELKAKIQAGADRERTVILADAQKDSQIQRGMGEGVKTEILNSAFGQDEGFFEFYRSMEAYSEAFGEGTTMVLSPDSDFFQILWRY